MEDETLVEVIAYLSNARLEDLRAGQLRALKPLAAPLKPQEAQ